MQYSSGNFECPICNDFTDDERIVTIVNLPCGHSFHKDCLLYTIKSFSCPIPNCGVDFSESARKILGDTVYECIMKIAESKGNSKKTLQRAQRAQRNKLTPEQEVAIALRILYESGIPTRFFPYKVEIQKPPATLKVKTGYYAHQIIENVINCIVRELYYGGFYFGKQPEGEVGRDWESERGLETNDADLTDFLKQTKFKLRGTVIRLTE